MLVLKNLRKQMEDAINNSGLPIDAIYFILKDILNEVTQICENVAKEEELQQIALKEQEGREKEDTNEGKIVEDI